MKTNTTTYYYLSWHPSTGTYCSRCFNSEAERESFYNRVKDIPHANCKKWEFTFEKEA